MAQMVTFKTSGGVDSKMGGQKQPAETPNRSRNQGAIGVRGVVSAKQRRTRGKNGWIIGLSIPLRKERGFRRGLLRPREPDI